MVKAEIGEKTVDDNGAVDYRLEHGIAVIEHSIERGSALLVAALSRRASGQREETFPVTAGPERLLGTEARTLYLRPELGREFAGQLEIAHLVAHLVADDTPPEPLMQLQRAIGLILHHVGAGGPGQRCRQGNGAVARIAMEEHRLPLSQSSDEVVAQAHATGGNDYPQNVFQRHLAF